MRRRHVLPGLLLAAGLLVAPALAGAPKLDNEYEGRAERDQLTYVGFDVVKKQGDKKVAKVMARLHYHCENGFGPQLRAQVKGKLPVNNGRFAGTLRGTFQPETTRAARGVDASVEYRFSGKFRKRGKARGEIDAEVMLPPPPTRGDEDERLRCYTGGLDWKAKRGAEAGVIKLREGSR